MRLALIVALVFCLSGVLTAQANFEKRHIDNIEIVFDGAEQDAPTVEQLRLTAADALGATYSAVRVRDSIAALHNTKRVVSAIVEASENGPNGVNLRYTIKLQTQAQKVTVEVGNAVGDTVTEQELLFKLNLLDPGAAINEQTLKNNADIILEYLRDRGFFKSSVKYTLTPLEHQNDVGVQFDVVPNEQAHVESFTINIQGFDNTKLQNVVKLKPGELYSRDRLNKDLDSIKNTLHAADFLAPELEDPRVVYDSDRAGRQGWADRECDG